VATTNDVIGPCLPSPVSLTQAREGKGQERSALGARREP
jgi:hypothetical protein